MGEALDERISFGYELVEAQARLFADLFGGVDSQWKRDGSRVTEADYAISRGMETALKERFSQDPFLSEEMDPERDPIAIDSPYAWLADPIDGTNNFARGIPSCSISLALLENGYPVYGFIYDHMSRSILRGGRGRGVAVRGRALGVSDTPPGSQSIVGCQHCESESNAADDQALQERFKIRNLGSSAVQLAYVAAGWLDGLIAHRVNSWDIAAGVALVEEAGGAVHYFDDSPFPLERFDVNAPSFAYMAGSKPMLRAMLDATGR